MSENAVIVYVRQHLDEKVNYNFRDPKNAKYNGLPYIKEEEGFYKIFGAYEMPIVHHYDRVTHRPVNCKHRTTEVVKYMVICRTPESVRKYIEYHGM